MSIDGICAGHVQNWVTQPHTWPAQILLVIMITCVGLRKRRARNRVCDGPRTCAVFKYHRLHLAPQDKGDGIEWHTSLAM